jgi:hypothetical protein
MNQAADNGINDGNTNEALTHELRALLEAGRVIVADFKDAIHVYVDRTPQSVQDDDKGAFAVFEHSDVAANAAMLLAAIITDLCPTGELKLPSPFDGEIKTAAELITEDELGQDGNVGTLSDNHDIKILDSSGREIN